MDQIYSSIKEEGDDHETYKIMQVTDWHVDYSYKQGANKNCKEEICCQDQHGAPETKNDMAREYGEFTCDIPYLTAEKQIEWISKNE